MHYLIISFSHKNSDISTREKLSFNNEDEKKIFIKNNINHNITELILLSTCNRIEIIATAYDILPATKSLIESIANRSKIDFNELEGRADIYEDSGAIHHLFSVSSSLDSLVIGETQITGQLKDAFRLSFDNGFAKQKLPRAMHYAFKCAATVRNSTDISKNSVSVSSTAVVQAKELLGGSLGGFTAVVIGIGEMSKLLIKSLVQQNCNIILFVRNIEKTKEIDIVKEFNDIIDIKHISQLNWAINRYRLLFSATSSEKPIITDSIIEEVDFNRYWFDIALPRDIEISNNFQNINIYCVDDLKDIVYRNLSLREEQAKIAYSIVGRFSVEFFTWLNSLSIEPFIKEIRLEAENIKKEKIENAIKNGYIPKENVENIDKLISTILNKFLHIPTNNLRKVSKEAESDTIIESMKRVFSKDSSYRSRILENRYKCERYLK